MSRINIRILVVAGGFDFIAKHTCSTDSLRGAHTDTVTDVLDHN